MAEEGVPPSAPPTQNIESFNLRDLLDVPIFTPSRQVDSVHNTPAIISVITAEEISDMGAETLYDVLNTVPGVEVTETLGGSRTVIIRGILPGETNNNSLLLLNGHPMREFQNGAYYLEAIPITAVKQIEIVRGPGSVEYGTNGFAGVINIITKDGEDPNTNRVQVQYGQFHTADAAASAGVTEGAFAVFLAAEHRSGDGYSETVVDVSGQGTVLRNQDNFDNAFIKINWKDFTLSGQYYRNTKTLNGLFLEFFSPHGISYHDAEFVELKYKHAVSDAFTVFATVSFDTGRKENDFSIFPWPPASAGVDAVGLGSAPIAPDYLYAGTRLYAETRVSWQPVDWTRLVAGLQYELNSQYPNPIDPIASMPFERESDAAAFAEAFVNPTSKLGLSAGVRYDQNSKSGGVVVPRAGVVYNVTQDVSLKLLYGRAYRQPTFNERYWAFWGGDYPQVDPNTLAPIGPAYVLKPEKIDTVELGVDWKIGRHALRVNAFYLNISDLISLSQNGTFYNFVFQSSDNEVRYGNSAGYSALGAEAEIRGYPIPTFFYFVNASTKYAYQDTLSQQLPYRSPILANAGITYTFSGPFRLKVSTYATLTGPRSGPLSSARNTIAYPNDTLTVPAYVVWNANLTYPVVHNFEVSLLLHNITNTYYSFPDFSTYGPVVPAQRFSAFGRATLTF